MRPNDLVVVPMRGGRAAVGVIVGDYRFQADEDDPYLRHRRQVRWTAEIDRSVLDDQVRKVVNAPGTEGHPRGRPSQDPRGRRT